MSLSLPFKTLPSDDNTELIGNETIGIVPVKKIGCLTPNEKIAWDRYVLKISKEADDEQSEGELVVGLVTIMLRSRLNPEWTEDDTRAIPSYPLVEAMLEFFKNERNRWEPTEFLLKFEGKYAKEQAEKYAKEIRGVAITRNDLKSLNIYFVYDNRGVIPVSGDKDIFRWEVVAAFDFEEILEKAEGNGSAKKPRSLTGQKSAIVSV